MERGQNLDVRVKDIVEDGQAFALAEDGRAVFIRSGESGEMPLPGDLVRVQVVKVKKRFAQTVLEEILEPSDLREADASCPHAGNCGGCPLIGFDYEAQLELKREHVTAALERIGGLSGVRVNRTIGMEIPFVYRNKSVFAVGEENGRPVVGFYQRRTHRPADCPECKIQIKAALACADVLRAFMTSDHIRAFDPKTGNGLIRQMIVRTAFGTGEVMVVLVINGKGIPNGEKLVAMLDDAIYNLGDDPGYALTSVWVNRHPGKSKESFGKNSFCLAGARTIREEIGGMTFEIGPTAFYQVNPQMMGVLYDCVADYAKLREDSGVLDVYCGAGTIGLWLANRLGNAVDVVGIESNHEAVVAANRNAVLNNNVRARYVEGKAEEIIGQVLDKDQPAGVSTLTDDKPHLTDIADAGKPERSKRSAEIPVGVPIPKMEKVDVAVLDPPRAGCDERLLQACVDADPERMIYVSCEPPTMARDLKFLAENGYAVREVTPVDMFPQSSRVEAVCVLSHSDRAEAD